MKRAKFVTYISFVVMIAIGVAGFVLRANAEEAGAAPLATVNIVPSSAVETATVTEYATPTTTLQSVETLQAELKAAQDKEYQTRLELVSLMEQGAVITAEHENNLVAFGQQTQAARELDLAEAQLTATVIPVMATEAQANRDYQESQNQFAREYPKIVREKAESEAYASSARAITAAEIFLEFVFGFSVVVLLSLLVFVVVYRGRKTSVEESQPSGLIDLGELERQEAQRQMFFRPAVNEQKEPVQKRMQTEIPCPPDEFLQFAEGLVRLNQKLTFAAWRGSPVYKYLNALRHWMEGEGFAEPIPNHTDEMTVTADGEKFLTESLDAGEPVKPYYCKPITEKENQTS